MVLTLQDHHPDGQGLSPFKKRHAVELYDLAADPEAVHDAAEREPARAMRMRGSLVDWLQARESLGWGLRNTRSSAMKATLQALGYAGTETAPEQRSDAVLFPKDCGCEECLRWQDALR